MKQLLINDEPINICLDETNIYNAITVMEQETEKPRAQSPFTSSW